MIYINGKWWEEEYMGHTSHPSIRAAFGLNETPGIQVTLELPLIYNEDIHERFLKEYIHDGEILVHTSYEYYSRMLKHYIIQQVPYDWAADKYFVYSLYPLRRCYV